MDLVLSSGFLAFAAHAGFLQAVDDVGMRSQIKGICGTSSGALAGALWAAGHSGEQIYTLLTRDTPWSQISVSHQPWRGLFTLDTLESRLEAWLPPRVADLNLPFGAGTVCERQPVLLNAGSLPKVVAASCAVPWLFTPVEIDGTIYSDGGALDRVFWKPWQQIRGSQPTVVHLLARSGGAVGAVPNGPAVTVVHSPRSGARLWNLGDARERFERTREHTALQLGLLSSTSQRQ